MTITPTAVLDLPQLYTHPPAAELLATLELLALKPASWDPRKGQPDSKSQTTIDENGIPKYLTDIVSCPLSWIDDERKEQIWEAASKRLSERAGRTAIPSVSRTFSIPNPFTKSSVEVTLYEPSLTSDNLGHKTWVASYLLAQRLPFLLPYLPCLQALVDDDSFSSDSPSPNPRPRILELGAGTGLVGIAAAAYFPADVHLTDLPAIVPNLLANVAQNDYIIIRANGGKATAGVLDWSDLTTDENPASSLQKSDIILAADPLYSPLHPAWLTDAIDTFLKREGAARVIVELPLRDAYLPEIGDFKRRMEAKGFVLSACGEEVGYDDWEGGGGGDREMLEVRCWWGVWGWADMPGRYRVSL